jgi:mono/diheme cytochrome c family protein
VDSQHFSKSNRTINMVQNRLLAVSLLTAGTLLSQSPPRGNRPPASFPEAPGRDTVVKVCGGCHGADVVVSKGMSRQQWSDVIASMVTRGAKGTEQEFAKVLDYLTVNLPPDRGTTAAPTRAGNQSASAAGGRRGGGGGGGLGWGADDKHVVDAAAADRGKTIYIAECITCHGNKARGSEHGSDLVRSLTVLHDRYASTIGPFLKKGHPMQSGHPSANLTEPQLQDLAHFLHQRVYDTLRTGPYSQVINVVTGDPKAGAAYFNAAGKCNTCHSPTGDLAGIASKYDPPALQQRFLFPRTIGFGRRGPVSNSKPTMLTVTPPSGPAVTGVLVHLDDFDVAVRDSSGEYHAWKRTPDLKVTKDDPYAAHIALLDEYTDKDIHDIISYLVTLK